MQLLPLCGQGIDSPNYIFFPFPFLVLVAKFGLGKGVKLQKRKKIKSVRHEWIYQRSRHTLAVLFSLSRTPL